MPAKSNKDTTAPRKRGPSPALARAKNEADELRKKLAAARKRATAAAKSSLPAVLVIGAGLVGGGAAEYAGRATVEALRKKGKTGEGIGKAIAERPQLVGAAAGSALAFFRAKLPKAVRSYGDVLAASMVSPLGAKFAAEQLDKAAAPDTTSGPRALRAPRPMRVAPRALPAPQPAPRAELPAEPKSRVDRGAELLAQLA